MPVGSAAFDSAFRFWAQLSLELLQKSDQRFQEDYLKDESAEVAAARRLLRRYQQAEYDEVQKEIAADNLTLKLLGLVHDASLGADVADAGGFSLPVDSGLLEELDSVLDGFEARQQARAESQESERGRYRRLTESLRRRVPPPADQVSELMREALQGRPVSSGWGRFLEALDRVDASQRKLAGSLDKTPQLQAEQRWKARQTALEYTRLLQSLGSERMLQLLQNPPRLGGTAPELSTLPGDPPSQDSKSAERDRSNVQALRVIFPESFGDA